MFSRLLIILLFFLPIQGFRQPASSKSITPADRPLTVRAYPNPVVSTLFVHLYADQPAHAILTITSLSGQLLQSQMLELPQGYSDHILSMANYLPGMYLLIVREPDSAKQVLLKIVKR